MAGCARRRRRAARRRRRLRSCSRTPGPRAARRASRICRAPSRVQTAGHQAVGRAVGERPARRASSSNGMTTSTGPKTSSCAEPVARTARRRAAPAPGRSRRRAHRRPTAALGRELDARRPAPRSTIVPDPLLLPGVITSGPRSRSLDAGPARKAAKRSARRCEHLVDRGLRSTRTRLPAEQVWPHVLDDGVDQHRQRRVEVGVGEHQLRRLAAQLQRAPGSDGAAAACATRVPVSGVPVNEMWSMPGCSASAAPASLPSPVTTLSAPARQAGFRGERGDPQQRSGRRPPPA